MKQNRRNALMMVVMFLMATSVWAGGTVTIVKKLNGTQNNSAGVVTSSIQDVADGKLCTLSVTPAEGNYAFIDNIMAEKILDAGSAQSRFRAPSLSGMMDVSITDETADPSGLTQYTFMMPGADYDVLVEVNFQSRISIDGAMISLAEETFVFNNEEQCATVDNVMLATGETELGESDYEVSYSNNINAGMATVTVTGKGYYMGTASTTFIIEKASLDNLTVSIDGWAVGATPSQPLVEGNEGNGRVTFTYSAAGSEAFEATVPTAVGSYVVKATVAETNNYEGGEATKEFSITRSLVFSFSETAQWATYFAAENLETPAGLQAYLVTDITEEEVLVEEIGYIPANVPVLIENQEMAEGPFEGVAYTDQPQQLGNTPLVGLSTATAVAGLQNDDVDVYVLYNNEFVKSISGTLPANRCYLAVPKDLHAEARMFIHAAGGATGVSLTAVNKASVSGWFDLSGRRLTVKPAGKGLYIHNGRKLVIE